jgi:hypothetical protein
MFINSSKLRPRLPGACRHAQENLQMATRSFRIDNNNNNNSNNNKVKSKPLELYEPAGKNNECLLVLITLFTNLFRHAYINVVSCVVGNIDAALTRNMTSFSRGPQGKTEFFYTCPCLHATLS